MIGVSRLPISQEQQWGCTAHLWSSDLSFDTPSQFPTADVLIESINSRIRQNSHERSRVVASDDSLANAMRGQRLIELQGSAFDSPNKNESGLIFEFGDSDQLSLENGTITISLICTKMPCQHRAGSKVGRN